jgi:hypothetical protein
MTQSGRSAHDRNELKHVVPQDDSGLKPERKNCLDSVISATQSANRILLIRVKKLLPSTN